MKAVDPSKRGSVQEFGLQHHNDFEFRGSHIITPTCLSIFTFEEFTVVDARANLFSNARHSISTMNELEHLSKKLSIIIYIREKQEDKNVSKYFHRILL